MDVAGQHVGPVGLEELGHEGRGTTQGVGLHLDRDIQSGQFVVADAGRCAQPGRLALLPRPCLRVGVPRARAEHEVPPAVGVGREEVQVLVGGRVERGRQEHRKALGRLARRQLTAA